MKIIFTGGHITPAIAVADALHTRLPDAQIVFVGRTTALEGARVPAEEVRVVQAHGFRFLAIATGRLNRTLRPLAFIGILRIPVGFFQAMLLLLRERPNAIVSFGGYVALPAVIGGWVFGIPSITHEQTAVPGLANRIIGLFAKKICVNYADTARSFPKHKTLVTGLPIRKSVFHPPKSTNFILDRKKPLLLITGGSTGAQSINRLVFPIVARLVKEYSIIHQTGRIDIAKAPEVADYVATPYLDESAYAWAINNASLIIARSGANTVGEIATLGKVAIFIPLPWSAGDEQYYNARVLVDAGSSKVVFQQNLTSEELLQGVATMTKDMERFRYNAGRLAKTMPTDAAALVAAQVAALLSNV